MPKLHTICFENGPSFPLNDFIASLTPTQLKGMRAFIFRGVWRPATTSKLSMESLNRISTFCTELRHFECNWFFGLDENGVSVTTSEIAAFISNLPNLEVIKLKHIPYTTSINNAIAMNCSKVKELWFKVVVLSPDRKKSATFAECMPNILNMCIRNVKLYLDITNYVPVIYSNTNNFKEVAFKMMYWQPLPDPIEDRNIRWALINEFFTKVTNFNRIMFQFEKFIEFLDTDTLYPLIRQNNPLITKMTEKFDKCLIKVDQIVVFSA